MIAAGCRSPEVSESEVPLRVAFTPDCRPASTPALTLIAQGHFPADAALFAPVSALSPDQRVPGFPETTLQYRLDVQADRFLGAGLAEAQTGPSQDVLVLPLGMPCQAVADTPEAIETRAIVAYGQTELLVAGGLEVHGTGPQGMPRAALGEAHRAVLSRGRWEAVPEALFVPRHGATASALGSEVIVAGGSQLTDSGAPALASFERYDASVRGFSELGRMVQARMQHAAAVAADGSTWLAGGRGSTRGPRLNTLERLAPSDEQFRPIDARLLRASAHLRLLSFDDGSVVALDFDDSLPTTVQRFDAAGERRTDEPPLDYTTTPALVAVSLGVRLVGVEVDPRGQTTGRVCTRTLGEPDACLSDWLTPIDGLSAARTVALRDGRLLLTGEDRAGRTVARVLDLSRRVVESHSLAQLPLWSGLLGDGSVALLHASGVDLLREDVTSAVAGLPSTLLAPDATSLSLDLVDHWRWQGLTLIARTPDARADLASLRFADVSIEVSARGDFDLLLGTQGSPTRAIRLGSGQVGPSNCTLPRPQAGVTLQVLRREEQLELRAGDQNRTCRLPDLRGPVRIGLRAAEADARIERFVVRRL